MGTELDLLTSAGTDRRRIVRRIVASLQRRTQLTAYHPGQDWLTRSNCSKLALRQLDKTAALCFRTFRLTIIVLAVLVDYIAAGK